MRFQASFGLNYTWEEIVTQRYDFRAATRKTKLDGKWMLVVPFDEHLTPRFTEQGYIEPFEPLLKGNDSDELLEGMRRNVVRKTFVQYDSTKQFLQERERLHDMIYNLQFVKSKIKSMEYSSVHCLCKWYIPFNDSTKILGTNRMRWWSSYFSLTTFIFAIFSLGLNLT